MHNSRVWPSVCYRRLWNSLLTAIMWNPQLVLLRVGRPIPNGNLIQNRFLNFVIHSVYVRLCEWQFWRHLPTYTRFQLHQIFNNMKTTPTNRNPPIHMIFDLNKQGRSRKETIHKNYVLYYTYQYLFSIFDFDLQARELGAWIMSHNHKLIVSKESYIT